ncbi:MAG TPA: SIR2 family protein [Thermoleophilaceae bacterium]|nr:SIR2 family protein [Thermoleophilaceae bacterium]
MEEAPLERLKRQVAEGRAVFFVGAGLSIEATDGRPTVSWRGFLTGGVSEVMRSGIAVPDGWEAAMLSEIASGDPVRRRRVEDELIRYLGAGSPAFADWLRRNFGGLPLPRRETLGTLAALGAPLLTLNYDDLLERVTGRPFVTWCEPDRMRRVIQGNEAGIIHPYGCWRDPGSVVMGSESYARIEAEEAIRRLVESISYTHTLVLVGFGGPLDSVNFTPLRSWLSDPSEHRHLRLVCALDRPLFEGQPEEEAHLTHIEYGPDYKSLAPFLGSLIPPGEAEAARPAERDAGGGRRLLEKLGGVGVFGLVATAAQVLGLGGAQVLLLAIAAGFFAYLLGGAFAKGRPTPLAAGKLLATFAVVAGLSVWVVLAEVSKSDPPAPTDASAMRAPFDGGSEIPAGAPSPVDDGPQTETSASDGGPRGGGHTERAEKSPAKTEEATRTKRIQWYASPDTARALGLLLAVGEVDFADSDGEDVLHRLIARVGAMRCPAVGAWGNVRTGDRFTVATANWNYTILIEQIDFAGSAAIEMAVSRRVGRRSANVGCGRS